MKFVKAFAVSMALIMTMGTFTSVSGASGNNDPRAILHDNLITVVDAILDAATLNSSTGVAQTTFLGNFTYTPSITTAGVKKLMNLLAMPEDFATLTKLVLDTGFDMSFGVDLAGVNPQMLYNMSWMLKDTPILSLESFIKKNVLYFGVADLFSDYYAIDFDDYGMDVKDVINEAFEELSYSMGFYDYEEMLSLSTSLSKYIAEYKNEISIVLYEIIDTVLNEIQTISFKESSSVTLNGKTVSYGKVSVILSERDIYHMGIAISQLILDNRDYLRLAVDLINEANGYKAITVAEFRDELSYMVDSDEDELYFSDDEYELVFYMSDDSIVGSYMYDDYGSAYGFLFDQNNGFEVYTDNGYEQFKLYGAFDNTDDIMSGDIWVEYEPGEWSGMEAFKLKVADFEGTMVIGEDGSIDQNMTFTFTPSEYLGVFGTEVLYDIPEEILKLINSSAVNVTADYSIAGADISCAYNLNISLDDDIAIAFDLAFETGENVLDITEPDPSKLSYISAYDVPRIGALEILSNIGKLITKIDDLGYSIKDLDNFINSMFADYMYLY